MIKIYRGEDDTFFETPDGIYCSSGFSFDALFQSDAPLEVIERVLATATHCSADVLEGKSWRPPIADQEVWAAGVTYFRSRTARMEESESSGGDRFYDMVYEAERPELFFKATAARTRGHLDKVRIREDSTWDVPEPELTLAINSNGRVFGYTIGNDMSSRSIEGDNPLYLPQAKVYRGSCAIGPCLVVGKEAITPESTIGITIERAGDEVFAGETTVSQIKRGFDELAGFLYRENEFPNGAYLMTGTGVVPDSNFTLQSGDRIRITVDAIGTLDNTVE
jgi:2-dehydro-3-deoxy-D-arabinonate dehydratase